MATFETTNSLVNILFSNFQYFVPKHDVIMTPRVKCALIKEMWYNRENSLGDYFWDGKFIGKWFFFEFSIFRHPEWRHHDPWAQMCPYFISSKGNVIESWKFARWLVLGRQIHWWVNFFDILIFRPPVWRHHDPWGQWCPYFINI